MANSLKEFKTLFGLSKFTYIKELGQAGYEGDLEKQSGGEHKTSMLVLVTRCQFGNIWKSWTSKWFILRDSFVAYINHNHNDVRFVLLFDNNTQFEVKDKRRDKLRTVCFMGSLATTQNLKKYISLG